MTWNTRKRICRKETRTKRKWCGGGRHRERVRGQREQKGRRGRGSREDPIGRGRGGSKGKEQSEENCCEKENDRRETVSEWKRKERHFEMWNKIGSKNAPGAKEGNHAKGEGEGGGRGGGGEEKYRKNHRVMELLPSIGKCPTTKLDERIVMKTFNPSFLRVNSPVNSQNRMPPNGTYSHVNRNKALKQVSFSVTRFRIKENTECNGKNILRDCFVCREEG